MDMKELYRKAGWDAREVHFSLRDIAANLDNCPVIDEHDEEQIFRAEFNEDLGLIFYPTGKSIVRCKDCKYYKQLDDACPYLGEDGYYKELPGEDDFCSRGERKE